MRRLEDLRELASSHVAPPTQTWMMLTFALFVGTAVARVGLYSFFVLRGQVYDAARDTLRGAGR